MQSGNSASDLRERFLQAMLEAPSELRLQRIVAAVTGTRFEVSGSDIGK